MKVTDFMQGYKELLVPEPEGHKNEPDTTETWIKWHQTKGRSFDEIIESAEELGRDYLVAAVSGGKDSISLTDMLDRKGKLKGVFHIKTNTGAKITTDFVKDTCQSRGWTLYIREPSPFRFIYAAMVLEVGFPGPALHSYFMGFLKYKVMKKFVRESHFPAKRIALASGVREQESDRRKYNYDAPISQDGKMWIVCPWFYESTPNIYRYFIENNLSMSPAHKIGGFSMECGCGSFAGYNELEAWRRADPERVGYFEWLKQGIELFGSPLAKLHSDWGGKGATLDEAQMTLAQFPGFAHFMKVEALVCGSECGPSTMRGAGYV